ncbi:SDR family oxidoreductase [Pelagibacteraceae bacterium]|jgi:NAD(P)-dependent dehydrogenase (short-subunit alcohol dehydrogenase family)|nr:SDR family oxidoreductase [Pelagibacteraceae bacterium]
MFLKDINTKNKIALITGAGKGIGKACAIALAEAGAHVIIISRTEKDLIEVQKIIRKLKRKCTYFVCDVTNIDEIKKIFTKISKLDILINNAGTNRPEFFTKIKRKDMSEVVDLNIKASFDIAQLSTKLMLKSKNRKKIGGSIINLSSQLGKVGAPLRSVYNMTKFGIEGLTKGMAIDLAKHNIRVNSICPTFVETPMVKKFFKNKDFKKSVIKNIPLGKVATESDIATAVVYLASDASSMMTGSSLVIDGGWTAK